MGEMGNNMPHAFFQGIKNYRFSIILLIALLLGSLTGVFLGPKAIYLKPFGDIFLNMMFTVVVPLVFFSISSAIAGMAALNQLWRVISRMLIIFFIMSLIAALFMLIVVKIYPPGHGVVINLPKLNPTQHINYGEEIVNMFTVPDFIQLFSRGNMLALIFFAVFVGFATTQAGEKGKLFADFLQSGMEISMKIVGFVMYYAPIGFFAYFAYLVGQLGPQMLTTYLRSTIAYYPSALVYFVLAYSCFAYVAAGRNGVNLFWKNVLLPALTALATCSSAASIPANLQATKKTGVPPEIFETVVPLGGILHKEGSVLGGMVKIAFLFGIYHLNFTSPGVIIEALIVAVLVGTVMGAIPSGGMVGEMLILNVYGFPPQALVVIAAISLIIDPPATVLNVTGNMVGSMLVARFVNGKNWILSKREMPP